MSNRRPPLDPGLERLLDVSIVALRNFKHEDDVFSEKPDLTETLLAKGEILGAAYAEQLKGGSLTWTQIGEGLRVACTKGKTRQILIGHLKAFSKAPKQFLVACLGEAILHGRLMDVHATENLEIQVTLGQKHLCLICKAAISKNGHSFTDDVRVVKNGGELGPKSFIDGLEIFQREEIGGPKIPGIELTYTSIGNLIKGIDKKMWESQAERLQASRILAETGQRQSSY
jgi:hypothetical protein